MKERGRIFSSYWLRLRKTSGICGSKNNLKDPEAKVSGGLFLKDFLINWKKVLYNWIVVVYNKAVMWWCNYGLEKWWR
jgi:hypothetical protein